LRDESARDRVIALASKDRDMETRHRARAAARAQSWLDDVDLVSSYGLDLRQLDTCEKRREIVSKLRALGNPDAISHLRRAANRTRGGIAGIGAKPVNRCL